MKKYPLCLGNISRDFSGNNMKKKTKNENKKQKTKQDYIGGCTISLLIIDFLILVITTKCFFIILKPG